MIRIRLHLIDIMIVVTALSVFLGGMSLLQELGGLLAFVPPFFITERIFHRTHELRQERLVAPSVTLALASAVGAPITMALYCMALDPASILVTSKYEWEFFAFWMVVIFFPLGFVEGILLGAVVMFFRQPGKHETNRDR